MAPSTLVLCVATGAVLLFLASNDAGRAAVRVALSVGALVVALDSTFFALS